MRLEAIHLKLDKILSLCKKHLEELQHLAPRKIDAHDDKVENPSGNEDRRAMTLAGNPDRHGLTLADCIQAIISVLLFAAFVVSIFSYKASSDSTKKQLRAFLYVEKIEVGAGAAGQPYLVQIQMRNSGDTPARNVSVIGGGHYMIDCPCVGPVKSLSGHTQNVADTPFGLIAPKAGSTAMSFLKPQDVDDIRKGSKSDLEFGDIIYTDIFGDRHVTKFCQNAILIAEENPEKFLFSACSVHNCDDENCPASE